MKVRSCDLDVRKCLIDDVSLTDADVVITWWNGCIRRVVMSAWRILHFVPEGLFFSDLSTFCTIVGATGGPSLECSRVKVPFLRANTGF